MRDNDQQVVLIEHPNPHELRAFLAHEEKKGRLVRLSPVRPTAGGRFGAYVTQYRPAPARKWLRPAVGSAAGLAVLGVAWGLAALIGALGLYGVLGVAFVGALVWLAATLSGGREAGGCVVTVTVRHRCR